MRGGVYVLQALWQEVSRPERFSDLGPNGLEEESSNKSLFGLSRNCDERLERSLFSLLVCPK